MAARSLNHRASAFQPAARAGGGSRRKWTPSMSQSVVPPQSRPGGAGASTAASSPMPTRTPPPAGKRRRNARMTPPSLRIALPFYCAADSSRKPRLGGRKRHFSLTLFAPLRYKRQGHAGFSASERWFVGDGRAARLRKGSQSRSGAEAKTFIPSVPRPRGARRNPQAAGSAVPHLRRAAGGGGGSGDAAGGGGLLHAPALQGHALRPGGRRAAATARAEPRPAIQLRAEPDPPDAAREIGRASCRER